MTPNPDQPKKAINLRLKPELLAFVDAQARERFQTRNEYLTSLVVAALTNPPAR